MPDAVQFAVTKRHDGRYKIIVQNEKEVIRVHYPTDNQDLTETLDSECRALRPINV